MMKNFRTLVCCSLAVALSACATEFKGGSPDYTKTGEAAKIEKARFHVDEMTVRAVKIQHQWYFIDNFRPVINDVSPAAETELKYAERWYKADWIFLTAAIATLFQPRDSWWYGTGYWIFISSAIGSGLYSNHLADKAGETFDRDLDAKFTPHVGASFEF